MEKTVKLQRIINFHFAITSLPSAIIQHAIFILKHDKTVM